MAFFEFKRCQFFPFRIGRLRWTTADRRRRGVKAYLVEGPRVLVDHLHDADDAAADEDGHAEDGPRVVARELVHGAVEARVRVRVGDVEDGARQRHLAGDARPQGEPAQLSPYKSHKSDNSHFTERLSSSASYLISLEEGSFNPES